MRKLAHLYWCVWNMDVSDSSFVEANDLQICVDVETDILSSQINMLDNVEDIERISNREECDTLLRGSMGQSKQLTNLSGDMARLGRNSSGPNCHGAQLNPSTADLGETAFVQHAVDGIGEQVNLTGPERLYVGPIPHMVSEVCGDGHHLQHGVLLCD